MELSLSRLCHKHPEPSWIARPSAHTLGVAAPIEVSMVSPTIPRLKPPTVPAGRFVLASLPAHGCLSATGTATPNGVLHEAASPGTCTPGSTRSTTLSSRIASIRLERHPWDSPRLVNTAPGKAFAVRMAIELSSAKRAGTRPGFVYANEMANTTVVQCGFRHSDH